LLGTRRALYENGRESITLTLNEVSPRALGGLIALYERAVGLYAQLVHINAYHQPGVEAGKKAASVVIGIQQRLTTLLADGRRGTAERLSELVGEAVEVETVYHVLEHLAANGRVRKISGNTPFDAVYSK